MTDDQLVIQRCLTCDRRLFPERLACSRCGSTVLDQEAAGGGTVVDHTEVRRAPSDSDGAPVRILLIRLDAGPQLLARDHEGLETGARVHLADAGGAVIAHAAA